MYDRTDHVLQLDSELLFDLSVCHVSDIRRTVRYLWSKMVLHRRHCNILDWHDHRPGCSERPNGDRRHGIQRCRSRQPTVSVSLDPHLSCAHSSICPSQVILLTIPSLAAIAEIVPNRQRGVAQAVLDVVTFPWAIFGGLIGNAMVSHGGLTFRINFLVGVCLNLTTIVTIWFWYHPVSSCLHRPTQSRVHTNLPRNHALSQATSPKPHASSSSTGSV